MMDVNRIREDFPIFRRELEEGKKIIYFDNVATSQRPIQVIEAIRQFYSMYNANVHRGLHRLSQEASELYEEAHEVAAKFIGAKSYREIVFVRNTTEALNLVAFSYGMKNVGRGDKIIITIMEHHSNMLPWIRLAELKGAKITVIDITDNYLLNYEMLAKEIDEKTKIVAIAQASNVLGTINDVRRISKLAHENNAIVVVDGAQSVPHMPVNVRDIDCDFLAFSGHKMLGPTGIGVLYGREELLSEMEPFMLGGGMISSVELDLSGKHKIGWAELPWKFEAGTPNIAGGIGLAEAIRYLQKVGMENIMRHERELTEYALRRMRELGESVETYGPKPEYRVGIIPFNLSGLDPHAVAIYLDAYGIAVRSGFHCAQPLHLRLGLKNGTVRAGFYLYNTKDEIDYFVEILEKILRGEV